MRSTYRNSLDGNNVMCSLMLSPLYPMLAAFIATMQPPLHGPALVYKAIAVEFGEARAAAMCVDRYHGIKECLEALSL